MKRRNFPTFPALSEEEEKVSFIKTENRFLLQNKHTHLDDKGSERKRKRESQTTPGHLRAVQKAGKICLIIHRKLFASQEVSGNERVDLRGFREKVAEHFSLFEILKIVAAYEPEKKESVRRVVMN
jgi:hypothetical protein